MAFDSDTVNVVLFGGESANTPQGDTWVYNLTNNSASWARVLITGPSPPPMSEAAMVYDSARKRCILFGGVDEDRYYDQTWLFEYKGNFTGVWTQLNPSSRPSARAGHSMVFDTNRNVAVLFGGENLTPCGFCFQQYNDTWEWDGNNWAERTPSTKPGHRVRHAMAWDSQRGVTVLFGGTVPTGDPFDYDEFRDTWEWNGVDWLQTANSPLEFRRQQHAMAFDNRRGKVVMFGGTREDPQTLGDDTDEYSGPAGWRSLFASGPPPRARHAMVYDSVHGKMVLFGGASGDTQYNDTWELIVHGPEFPRQPQNTNGPACGEVSFSAAVTGVGPLQYQWRKDGFDLFEGGRFVGVNSPTLRVTGLRFADEGVYQLAVTSACGESTSAGAALRVDAPWTHHIVNGPQPRAANAMAYDESRGVSVLFGGGNSSGGPSRETWEWNGNSWLLRAVSGPTPRWGHGMVYDPDRRKVLLFGGNRNRGDNPADFLRDTWEWDGRAWKLLATNGPSPRASFALAYDSVVRRTVLYGGQNGVGGGGQWLYDTWEFNSAAAQWVPVLGGWPAGFSLSTWPPKMAFDTRRGKRVLIDLYTVGIVFADFRLFEWDGVNWIRVTPLPDPKLRTGRVPGAVHDFGIAFDSTRNFVVINNGADPGNFFPRVTWGYDGTYWHRLDAGSGPEGYASGACTYDTQRSALVEFGGGVNVFPGYWGETWERIQADRLQVTRGPEAVTAPFGSLQLSVTIRGQPPYLFQWRKNGIPLSDSGSISGANSGVLTLFNPETARYDVVVSGPCGQTTSDVTVAPLPGGTIGNPGGTRLTISQEQSQWKLHWPDPAAQLFSSPQVTGTWSQVLGAISPHPVSASQPQQYFRLQGGSGCAGVPDGLVSWWRAEGNAADQAGANTGSVRGGHERRSGRGHPRIAFAQRRDQRWIHNRRLDQSCQRHDAFSHRGVVGLGRVFHRSRRAFVDVGFVRGRGRAGRAFFQPGRKR